MACLSYSCVMLFVNSSRILPKAPLLADVIFIKKGNDFNTLGL